MSAPTMRQTARFVYLLTERGHSKLMANFTKPTGELYDYNSVDGLDWRTVKRICLNRVPGYVGSLMVLFRARNLKLEPDDYEQAVRSRPESRNGSDPAQASRLSAAFQPAPDITPETWPCDEAAEEQETGEDAPLTSVYIERKSDGDLKAAIRGKESTILIKGPRQCGKSSLLARGFAEARLAGFQTVCTDFDALDTKRLTSTDSLYRAFANSLALKCGGEDPAEIWKTELDAAEKLEQYLRRFLKQVNRHIVWAMDGVDALVGCGFHEEVFSMFRAWYNARKYEPGGVWDRLTLILTCSAEASLFISSTTESPFNVATPIFIGDFSPEEMREMNGRYGSLLCSQQDEDRLYHLCGGHPFLLQLALFEIKSGRNRLTDLERMGETDGGIFLPHLVEIRAGLQYDAEYKNLVAAVARGQAIAPSVTNNRCFQRLRSAGVLKGESVERAEFRCELYRLHFTQYPVEP